MPRTKKPKPPRPQSRDAAARPGGSAAAGRKAKPYAERRAQGSPGLVPLQSGHREFLGEPADLVEHIEFGALPYIDEGGPGFTERVLPYVEREAIARLIGAGLTLGVPDPMDESWDAATWHQRWQQHRGLWVRVARRHLRTATDGPMSPSVTWCAAEVLTRAADLRQAIASGHAERSAALSMLVAGWLMTGGVGVRFAEADALAVVLSVKQSASASASRVNVEVDDPIAPGKMSKVRLVELACKGLPADAPPAEVWPRLIGVLDGLHLDPQEGATGTEIRFVDASGNEQAFTYSGVAKTLQRLRKTAGTSLPKGRRRIR